VLGSGYTRAGIGTPRAGAAAAASAARVPRAGRRPRPGASAFLCAALARARRGRARGPHARARPRRRGSPGARAARAAAPPSLSPARRRSCARAVGGVSRGRVRAVCQKSTQTTFLFVDYSRAAGVRRRPASPPRAVPGAATAARAPGEARGRRRVRGRHPLPRLPRSCWMTLATARSTCGWARAVRLRGARLRGESEEAERHEFPPPRTKWTRRVPHPVIIGHVASLTPFAVK